MKNGSPNLAVQNREFFRQAMDRRAIFGFMDRGGRSSLRRRFFFYGGGRTSGYRGVIRVKEGILCWGRPSVMLSHLKKIIPSTSAAIGAYL
jgi:hypothetical protein